MIESRRNPKPPRASSNTNSPASSGPRCVITSRIDVSNSRPTWPRVAPYSQTPQIPHIATVLSLPPLGEGLGMRAYYVPQYLKCLREKNSRLSESFLAVSFGQSAAQVLTDPLQRERALRAHLLGSYYRQ